MSATLAIRPARAARVLFAEDFDDVEGVLVIEAPPEPEVIVPAFTAADVEVVRAHAYADGRAAAMAEAEAAHTLAVRTAIAEIAAAMDALTAQQAAAAAREAEDVARLLLDTLMTMLPALCARHGEAEVRGVARAVLPALAREPAVMVRIHPDLVGAVEAELAHLDPEFAGRIRLHPAETLSVGDIRIGWADGSAVRDTAAVWREVAAALSKAGLLISTGPSTEDAARAR